MTAIGPCIESQYIDVSTIYLVGLGGTKCGLSSSYILLLLLLRTMQYVDHYTLSKNRVWMVWCNIAYDDRQATVKQPSIDLRSSLQTLPIVSNKTQTSQEIHTTINESSQSGLTAPKGQGAGYFLFGHENYIIVVLLVSMWLILGYLI